MTHTFESDQTLMRIFIGERDKYQGRPLYEVVAPEETIKGVLPELDRMIDGGLVTLERTHVILYRPHDAAEQARRD